MTKHIWPCNQRCLIQEEPTFVPSGIRNLIVPLEPQVKKGAWLEKQTNENLPKPCKGFDIQSRDQSISSGTEKKTGHMTLAGNDILDREELIRMSQLSMHKIEEFVETFTSRKYLALSRKQFV